MKVTGGIKEYHIKDEYIENSLFTIDSHNVDSVLYFQRLLSLVTSNNHKLIIVLLYAGFTKKETADILELHPSAISKAIVRSIKPAMDKCQK